MIFLNAKKRNMKFQNYIRVVLIMLVATAFSIPSKSEPADKTPVTIINTWEMPDELEEISGISWVNSNVIAAVEDEDGIIYMYDLKAEKVTQKIKFGDAGDYEGIAVCGKTIYVMRSDGLLYEVTHYAAAKPVVKTYQSAMSSKNNVETLTFVRKNNRLLMAPKEEDPNDEEVKGVYAFDLNSHKMLADMVFKVKMKDKAFKDFEKKKSKRTFRPSDMAINPKTGAIYMLEGVNPKLLKLDASGKIESVMELDKDNFAQPEGITFSPEGRLFISNEAHGGKANILEVALP